MLTGCVGERIRGGHARKSDRRRIFDKDLKGFEMVAEGDNDVGRARTAAHQRHVAVARGRTEASRIERERGSRALDPPRHGLLILDGQRLRKGVAMGERQQSDQQPAERR